MLFQKSVAAIDVMILVVLFSNGPGAGVGVGVGFGVGADVIDDACVSNAQHDPLVLIYVAVHVISVSISDAECFLICTFNDFHGLFLPFDIFCFQFSCILCQWYIICHGITKSFSCDITRYGKLSHRVTSWTKTCGMCHRIECEGRRRCTETSRIKRSYTEEGNRRKKQKTTKQTKHTTFPVAFQ